MADHEPIAPTPGGGWRPSLPSLRPRRVLGDDPGDVLTTEQRQRSAAAYEAGRMILAEDPPPEEIIMVADYIVTGRRPPAAVKVLPDESLLKQVCERVARAAQGVGPIGADSASWTATDPGGCRPNPPAGAGDHVPEWEQELLDKQEPTS